MCANLPETFNRAMKEGEENLRFIVAHLIPLGRLKLIPGSRIQAAVSEYLL